MIITLLWITLAQAATAPECDKKSISLKSFFSEYVEAYALADAEKLAKYCTESYWENFKDFLPKKADKKIYTFKIEKTREKNGHCLVSWNLIHKNKEISQPSVFVLQPYENTWKLSAIIEDISE